MKKGINKSVLIVLAVVLAMGAVLAGCGTDNASGDEQIFRLNLSSEPPALDPGIAQDSTSFTVINGIYEGLVRMNEDGEPVPAVAEDWEVSEDGKTYTFTLRDGVKWSNGDEVTAGDFEFAWKRALDPAVASVYAYQLYYLKNAQQYNEGEITDPSEVGVTAKDDKTLVVELNAPTPYFESLVGFFTYFPLNEKHVSATENWAADAETMVTNGPFLMDEWKKGDKIILKKNPDYREADDIQFEEVHMTMVGEESTELNMYQTGQLDWAGRPSAIPQEQIPSLKKDEEANLQIKGIATTYYYIFNSKAEPFQNENIRRAFMMSVDRQKLVDKVTLGDQQPAFGFVPPGIKGEKEEFRTEYSDDYFQENYDEAKQLLEQGMKEEGYATLPAITLTYNTSEGHKKLAEAIVDMWRQNLGVEVQLENQEWGVFLENRTNLNYQIARSGWGADYNDPMSFIDMWTTSSGNNDIGFSNPEYDQLVKEAYATDDNAARMEAMARAEEILIEETSSIMPIYYYTGIWAQKKYVKGVFIDYAGNIDFNRGYIEKE
ncbi:peptide ABC transporter substrate-binding protein [Marinicrinis sediminis]|uniref:Peptide ABC transporter substrate-binding protein n=1 Tax=Marinicrinis sediminis TaxID=1652465 RepID=A0ABW5RBF1_9BACL